MTLVLLGPLAACGPAPGPGAADSAGEEARWAVVQDYLDRLVEWQEQAIASARSSSTGEGTAEDGVRRAEAMQDEAAALVRQLLAAEEGERRAEAAPAAAPDDSDALAAARAIVDGRGPRTVDAAEFLLERSRTRVWQAGREEELWETLVAHVGPDWAVVQGRIDQQAAWGDGGVSLAERPRLFRAIAGALAILETDGAHAGTVDAAEFLVRQGLDMPEADRHLTAAARALAAHAPDYDGWLQVLGSLDAARGRWLHGVRPDSPVDAFLQEMADAATHPVLRAGARYYLAEGLLPAASDHLASPDDRATHRRRALDLAVGLSAGVEDEPFERAVLFAGAPLARTMAEAEAELTGRIRHATVGGRLPEVSGRRLDGIEEPLSAYRGLVLLIDFWGTWCRPCVAALPDLRKLAADLPADRFALLAISTDEELATVTDFLEDEPMPWHNWHAGPASELLRTMDVHVFPTYLLADEQGNIVVKGNVPFPWLRCMVEQTVAGEAAQGAVAACSA